ncbi:hypothetical protein ES332_A12G243500v1 [Gossypium tomentosum]|uniref:Uncharacterized protein n=1 Tax=Gossypium tomentosum TaxID=34277 RepID=A0A5D2N1V3_GOSTO|nr:hypothetical protein ES332_A12G243500v1 [Gossypium tomentosum]
MSELKQYGGKAMVDSWSKPFHNAFSEFKSVQLYEILMACLE